MVEGQVLVLNKSWVVVNVASVKRAMGLLYQDLARAVHPEDYSIYDFNDWCDLSEYQKTSRMITTSSREIRVPEVIILNAFNGFFKREIRFSRRNIFERDRHTCQYCQKRLTKSELTIDHVIPQSKGGQDSWENLALACVRCNVEKANRTPEQANMPLMKKPVKPTWLPAIGIKIPSGQLSSWQRFIDTAYWDSELRE